MIAEEHREAVRFFHLTFQEFHLARTLMDGEFRLALQRYWQDPRYEEALGLLLSLLAAQNRTSATEDGSAGCSTGDRRSIELIRLRCGSGGAARSGSACIWCGA